MSTIPPLSVIRSIPSTASVAQQMHARLLEDEVAARNISLPDPDAPPIYGPDPDEVESLGRITSQTILAGNSCGYKGQLLKLEQIPLELSDYAKDNTDDGHDYEEQIYRQTTIWVPQLNKKYGLSLPTEMVDLDCSVERPKDMPTDEYFAMTVQKTITHISEAVKLKVPAILRQATFAKYEMGPDGMICPEVGRTDLCIWTGEKFIIGDIKRSDEVMSAYVLQLYFYAACIRYMLGDTAEYLLPEGFIIHCSPGYVFSRHDTALEKKRAVDLSLVSLVDINLVSADFQKVYDLVSKGLADTKLRRFQTNCIECGYRNRCYPSLIEAPKTPLSLVPMDTSTYQALQEGGITTAEELGESTDQKMLLDILDKLESVTAIQHRARKASVWKGYSDWMPKPEWQKTVWFFGHVRLGRMVLDCWMDPDGRAYETLPDPVPFESFVAYTDVERKKGYNLLGSKLAISQRIKIERICLHEELVRWVHLPLPSYTLKSLAVIFTRLRNGESLPSILHNWFAPDGEKPSMYQQTEVAEATAEERVANLRAVWLGLHYLSSEMKKPS